MEKKIQEMFDFVEAQLSKQTVATKISSKILIDYSRFLHIKRVYNWMLRLYEKYENKEEINFEALQIATIFHDAGYGIMIEPNNHAEYGAKICHDYLVQKGFDSKLIEKVYYLVMNHSRKDLMFLDTTPIELVLLMEADLLDDTGAMGIVMDALIEGKKGETSFEKVLEHILQFSSEITTYNPMRTNAAALYWQDKQALVKEFIYQYQIDLGR